MESNITEEDFFLTPEQQQKLADLRLKNTQNKFDKSSDPEYKAWKDSITLKNNAPVSIQIDGVGFIGFILKLNDDNTAEVSTPHGDLTLPKRSLTRRTITDYSEVEIGEEIKKLHTKQLLKELQTLRSGAYEYGYYGYASYEYAYNREMQIRAELKNRPHIPSKKEKKIASKYVKK